MKYKKIPKYKSTRIYIVNIFLYTILVGISALFLFSNTLIKTLENPDHPLYKYLKKASETFTVELTTENITNEEKMKKLSDEFITFTESEDKKLEQIDKLSKKYREERLKGEKKTFSIFLFNLLYSFLIFYILNLPFKIFFRKKRKLQKKLKKHQKKYPDKKIDVNKYYSKNMPSLIWNYTRKLIKKSPLINSLIFLCTSIVLHLSLAIFMGVDKQKDLFLNTSFNSFLEISIIATLLSVIFVYLWQKHNVQNKYMYYVFTPEELKYSKKLLKFDSIGTRLSLSMIITAIIPLIFIMFYYYSSISSINELRTLSNNEIAMLFGNYAPIIKSMSTAIGVQGDVFSKLVYNSESLYYINIVDLWKLQFVIVSLSIVILIYIISLVKWTSASVVGPINELKKNMQAVEKGDLRHKAYIISNDEIGALAHGYNKMLKGLHEREQIKNLFGQYLTKEVSEEILKGRVNLGGDLYNASIMFADIRGFTSMSETMKPEEVVEFLNEYLNIMIEVILKHNGIIDKFLGDGILATFGIPLKTKKHALQALKAANEMNSELDKLNKQRKEKGKKAIKIGIGIHSGNVIAGNLGNEKKLEYTVIGDTVNLASRIESLTKKFKCKILLSEETYKILEKNKQLKTASKFSKFTIERKVKIRGKKEPLNLYKIS